MRMSPSSSLFLFIRSVTVVSLLVLFCSGFIPPACGSSTEPAVASGNETDRKSLLALKDGITSDPFGALNSWNHSVHFCQWFGVTCGRQHRQRVVMLELDHLQLRGSISPHIGNLSFLRELWLRNNSLGGKIPPEVGRLRRLQLLTVRNNSIGGEIPTNISSCSNLIQLELSGNTLEGIIPSEIGMLTKLEELYVGKNPNIAGNIPANLANLSSLRAFYASENSIQGSIPDQFGRLKNLEIFAVGYNELVGKIPPSIYNISSIKYFVVQDNQIEGELPSGLGGIVFPRLKQFDLDFNVFNGTIPASISNASHLEQLFLGENRFTGDVPSMERLVNLRRLILGPNYLGTAGDVDDLSFLSSLINATYLQLVDLRDNNLGGELPNSIGNLSSNNLKVLVFQDNQISGSIHQSIGKLVTLEILRWRHNKLIGNIPSTIGQLKKLQKLSLNDNELNGIIPPSFGNLSILLGLYLGGNNLYGNIPPSLGKCKSLQELSLSSNNLQGNIPTEIFDTSSLLITLDLGGNRLTGYLPAEVGSLINLEQLGISQNMFSGKIPSTLGSCVKLRVLYVNGNQFGGIFPPLISLRGLEELNLSSNNFSGNIPDYLGGFPFLQYLDLSFNDFEGPVPDTGIFKNATAFRFKGNVKLCGGGQALRLPSCNPKDSKNVKLTVIIVLALVISGFVVMLAILYHCFSKKSRKLPSLHVPWNTFLKLSYQNLYEATNGFCAGNLIGVGSFGSVYKGILHHGQQTVAVKVLNLQSQGASRSFLAECKALRRIRHRNLLKVLTACSSIDHEGNDFKALVYEFMANGSLHDWLHSHENQDEMQGDSRILNLSQRLDIAIDVASALEYLHHSCEQPIVHCDLKPNNILLDDDMVGHVGDFGLAKFLQEATTDESSGNQSNTIGLRGSVGYVAPEYGMGIEVSTAGDIYSYGVLLLEMFTGKRPTEHHMFKGCLNLRDYVERALPEQVETVADSGLLVDKNGSNVQSHDFPSSQECLVSLFKVGIACAQELPRDRMSISDAIVELHAIKKARLETSVVHGGGKPTLAVQSHVP